MIFIISFFDNDILLCDCVYIKAIYDNIGSHNNKNYYKYLYIEYPFMTTGASVNFWDVHHKINSRIKNKLVIKINKIK